MLIERENMIYIWIIIIILIILLLKKEEKFKVIGYNKNFCKNQTYKKWIKNNSKLLKEELKICDSNKENCHIY